MSAYEDENDPYTRWQGFRINQLGLCISLFLTFAVATLGFSVNLLVQPSYPITAWFPKFSFLLSLVLGLLSTMFGSLACVTRLMDFRKTAQVARHRDDKDMRTTVAVWREDYKRLGKWTWRLFKWQLFLFLLQALDLIVALAITFWMKLI